MGVTVDFCGEIYTLAAEGDELTVGREADLIIDDNRFLHRRFLRIYHEDGLWWVANVGTQLSATLSDQEGMVQAWLSPGARLPLVFASYSVWFTAGPTTYEFHIAVDDAAYLVVAPDPGAETSGGTTFGRTTLTPDQRLLLLALAEPALRRPGRGAVNAPTSSEAAARLGWALTKFNRKLDNVCQKLERLGVRGLHGGPERLATDRKSRLVEYALSARLVSAADLALLDSGPSAPATPVASG